VEQGGVDYEDPRASADEPADVAHLRANSAVGVKREREGERG
jgi:hypothetical protein